jgi:hypothetical protein
MESTRGGRVRFIVELRHSDDGVEGEVTPEGATEPQRFSGWLELLQLLEPSPGHGAEER